MKKIILPAIFLTALAGAMVGPALSGRVALRPSVAAAETAFWTPDNGGEWIVENHGVDPDYVVEQRPDLVAEGHDPQLEKAIELAMAELKNVKPIPPRPKYPKKN